MTNNEIKIDEIKNNISAQINELKKLWDNGNLTDSEMINILYFCNSLENTDFTKTVTVNNPV